MHVGTGLPGLNKYIKAGVRLSCSMTQRSTAGEARTRSLFISRIKHSTTDSPRRMYVTDDSNILQILLQLAHFKSLMEFPTLINRTSSFLFKGLLSDIFHICSNCNRTF